MSLFIKMYQRARQRVLREVQLTPMVGEKSTISSNFQTTMTHTVWYVKTLSYSSAVHRQRNPKQVNM